MKYFFLKLADDYLEYKKNGLNMIEVSKRTVFFLLFSLLFSACQKDKVLNQPLCEEIIPPGAYFPGFPGSWWSYSSSMGDSFDYEMATGYKTHYFGCMPFLKSRNKYLLGSSLLQTVYVGMGGSFQIDSPIYSLIEDSIMICPISFATNKEDAFFSNIESVRFRRVTTNLDTSLTVNAVFYSDVIEVFEFDITNPEHRYLDYFAKNVGLIRRDSLAASDTTNQIVLLQLKKYNIGW